MKKLEIEYFIRDNESKINRIYRTEFTENDLQEYLQNKFENGDLPCPIHLNRENFKVDSVNVTKVEL